MFQEVQFPNSFGTTQSFPYSDLPAFFGPVLELVYAA